MLKSIIFFASSALALTLPNSVASRQQCQQYATVSDPGFYVAASIPSSDFPDDEPYFENQVLQWLPDNGGSTCTLFGNFERDFPVNAVGKSAIEVYQRQSSAQKTKIGTVPAFPLKDGKVDDIQSWPIATFPCSSMVTLEFQLALSQPGSHGSVTFFEDASSGFFVLSC